MIMIKVNKSVWPKVGVVVLIYVLRLGYHTSDQGELWVCFFCYSDGENWHEQRRPISKFMMMPRKVAEYHEPFNDVTFDLLKKIRKSRDESGNLFDASSYFYKWSFECEFRMLNNKLSFEMFLIPVYTYLGLLVMPLIVGFEFLYRIDN